MKSGNLEAAPQRRPLRPFAVRVDGEALQVRHPELIMLAEAKSTAILVDPEDHIHIFDVDQISKLRLLPRRAQAGRAS